MDEAAFIAAMSEAFPGVEAMTASEATGAPEMAWGDTFFFYNPDALPENRMVPFATIVTKDYGDFDRASNLNRPGVFRLNIGVSPKAYTALFGPPPRGGASVSESDYDFAALDRLLPHPVYAPQSWVCVLNPSRETFETVVQPLLAEAYERAAGAYTRRAARD